MLAVLGALPCPALTYPILSYPVLSCAVLSLPVLFYPVLSCPVQGVRRMEEGTGAPPSRYLPSYRRTRFQRP